ncbi:MAG TPA: transcription factor [Blastocatellia bacterium]|nr:transcription factor [Blastocatellia bacterium]
MSSSLMKTEEFGHDLRLGQQPSGGYRSRMLDIDADTFGRNFNRNPFVIRHKLSGHTLFSLSSLIELSKRLPEDCVAYNAGDIPVGQGLYKGPRTGLSIQETIRRIEECRSWMVLKFVERDPRYRELLDACLDEVQQLSEPLAPGMRKREGFIFISSPGSVTPYHMDPEYNFLLQIRGSKTINIFDGEDRTVLSEEELEPFYADPAGEYNLSFKEEYRSKAMKFEIAPGAGLHFPATAPHWVENGPEVSISFSITFENAALYRRSIVYTANSRLRKLGVKPAPVGRSALRDSAKFYGFLALGRFRRLIKRPARS